MPLQLNDFTLFELPMRFDDAIYDSYRHGLYDYGLHVYPYT